MSLTSTDIRHAYMLIHKLPSIAELEKLGMLDAKTFPAEDLNLDIDAFMIKHGFKEAMPEREMPPSDQSSDDESPSVNKSGFGILGSASSPISTSHIGMGGGARPNAGLKAKPLIDNLARALDHGAKVKSDIDVADAKFSDNMARSTVHINKLAIGILKGEKSHIIEKSPQVVKPKRAYTKKAK